MEPGQTAAGFQSTLWSMVIGARVDRASLEQLLRAYWSPVYGFIRRQGYSGHDASDLTQEFLTQVVIGRDLIGKATPERGRFRAFLKQALRNFLIDQHRLGKASKGGAVKTVDAVHPERGRVHMTESLSDTQSVPKDNLIDTQLAAGGVFDREWAATIIERTLNSVEESCISEGLDAHWRAFSINVLGPAMRKTEPMPLNALALVVGAIDDTQVSNMLQTVKRKFKRSLRETIAETVGDPALVEQELAELREYL